MDMENKNYPEVFGGKLNHRGNDYAISEGRESPVNLNTSTDSKYLGWKIQNENSSFQSHDLRGARPPQIGIGPVQNLQTYPKSANGTFPEMGINPDIGLAPNTNGIDSLDSKVEYFEDLVAPDSSFFNHGSLDPFDYRSMSVNGPTHQPNASMSDTSNYECPGAGYLISDTYLSNDDTDLTCTGNYDIWDATFLEEGPGRPLPRHQNQQSDGHPPTQSGSDVGETLHITEMFLDEILNEPDGKRMLLGYGGTDNGRYGDAADNHTYGHEDHVTGLRTGGYLSLGDGAVTRVKDERPDLKNFGSGYDPRVNGVAPELLLPPAIDRHLPTTIEPYLDVGDVYQEIDPFKRSYDPYRTMSSCSAPVYNPKYPNYAGTADYYIDGTNRHHDGAYVYYTTDQVIDGSTCQQNTDWLGQIASPNNTLWYNGGSRGQDSGMPKLNLYTSLNHHASNDLNLTIGGGIYDDSNPPTQNNSSPYYRENRSENVVITMGNTGYNYGGDRTKLSRWIDYNVTPVNHTISPNDDLSHQRQFQAYDPNRSDKFAACINSSSSSSIINGESVSRSANASLSSSQLALIATNYPPNFSKARRLTVKELLTSARDKKVGRAGALCDSLTSSSGAEENRPKYGNDHPKPRAFPEREGEVYTGGAINGGNGSYDVDFFDLATPPIQRDDAFWSNYDFTGKGRQQIEAATDKENCGMGMVARAGKKVMDVKEGKAYLQHTTNKVKGAATKKKEGGSKVGSVTKGKSDTQTSADDSRNIGRRLGAFGTISQGPYYHQTDILHNGFANNNLKLPRLANCKRSPTSLIHWEPSYDESSNSVYGDDPYLSAPHPPPPNPYTTVPGANEYQINYETLLEDLLNDQNTSNTAPAAAQSSLSSKRNFNPLPQNSEIIWNGNSMDPVNHDGYYVNHVEPSRTPTKSVSCSSNNNQPSTRSRHFEFSLLNIDEGFSVDAKSEIFTQYARMMEGTTSLSSSASSVVPSKMCLFKMKILVAQRKIMYEFPLPLNDDERVSLIETSSHPIPQSEENFIPFMTNVEIDFKSVRQFYYKDPSLIIDVECAPRIHIVYKGTNNPACSTKISLDNLCEIQFLKPIINRTTSYHEIVFKRDNTLEKFRAYITNLNKFFPHFGMQQCCPVNNPPLAGQLNHKNSLEVPYNPNVTLYDGIDTQWVNLNSSSTNIPMLTSSAMYPLDQYQATEAIEYPKYSIEYETWGTQDPIVYQEKGNHHFQTPYQNGLASTRHIHGGPTPTHDNSQPINRTPVKHDDLSAKRKRLEAVAFRFAKDYCKCTSGCNTLRCICVKTGSACSASQEHNCQCVDCHNPLNMLRDEMAADIPIAPMDPDPTIPTEISQMYTQYTTSKANVLEIKYEIARSDICLMQNIYQITNLKSKLNTLINLTCCGTLALLKSCIPGIINCPNIGLCGAKFKYSWCLGIFFDESINPRNHCEICRRCVNKSYQHCYKCNRCYMAGYPPCKCTNCYPLAIPNIS